MSIDDLLRGFMGGPTEANQPIPINIFETETELVIVAPAPGIEPENLDIQIDDGRLTIRAEKRGPGQERQRYLRREWSYGPYERTLELPHGVDAGRANATYGNGLVTIALPKRSNGRARRLEITLEPIGATRGEHVGHRGRVEAMGPRRIEE